MKIHKLIYIMLLICLVQSNAIAEEIKIHWKIKNGDCKDCIKMPDEQESSYDFAVYGNRLFLTDFRSNTIKVFDKDNHNVKNIRLAAKAEIVTILGDKLYILLRNNSLNVYDIPHDSIRSVDIEDKFTETQYELAFFMDNLLYIPLSKDVFVKSDAKVYNIINPKDSDIITGFFDFSRLWDLPSDNSFAHSPSKLIDLCGGNGSYLIFDCFESSETSHASGYILFSKKYNTISKLCPIPFDHQILLHDNPGRGMKIVDNRIYFISEIISKHVKNAIIIGSYPLR